MSNPLLLCLKRSFPKSLINIQFNHTMLHIVVKKDANLTLKNQKHLVGIISFSHYYLPNIKLLRHQVFADVRECNIIEAHKKRGVKFKVHS